MTRAFDTADRPITGANGVGSYAYDGLGRTTTLPAADAPRPADGNVAVDYYDNDLARAITQGGTTTTYSLDALDRRSVETVTDAAGSIQTVRHYTDTGDSPAWATTGTTWQRYAKLITADLALTITNNGDAQLALANPHGDIVTTVSLPSAGTSAAGIGGWNSYDEYGNRSTTSNATTGALNYGWLGAKQRAMTDSGLSLMGLRLYNPITGAFTSADPMIDGGANAYAYPTEPIRSFDLTGAYWWGSVSYWSRWWSPVRWVKINMSRSGTKWLTYGSGAVAYITSVIGYLVPGWARLLIGALMIFSTYLVLVSGYAMAHGSCTKMYLHTLRYTQNMWFSAWTGTCYW